MKRSKYFLVSIAICGAFAVVSHAQDTTSPPPPVPPPTSEPLPSEPPPSGDSGMMGQDMPQTQGGMQGQRMGPQQISQLIQSWPDESRKAAQEIISKYGQPTEMTRSMLIWKDVGQFKKTVVYRDGVDHNFPFPHKAVLEQVIDYKVPLDKYDDIAQFNGSVVPERTKGELSASSNSEALNILALNLADQIATGQRSVSNARDFYGKTAQQVQLALATGRPGAPPSGAMAQNLPREASILLVDLTRPDTEDKDRAVARTQPQRAP